MAIDFSNSADIDHAVSNKSEFQKIRIGRIDQSIFAEATGQVHAAAQFGPISLLEFVEEKWQILSPMERSEWISFNDVRIIEKVYEGMTKLW